MSHHKTCKGLALTSVTRHVAFGGVATLVAVLGATTTVQAQTNESDATVAPRLYIDGQLGLFGDVRARSGDSSASDQLEPSGGGVIGVDVPLGTVFSLGVEGGATVWNSDGANNWDIDPSVLVHVSFVPRLRVPFGRGTSGGGHGAVYLAGLIGPSLDFISGDIGDGLSLVGARVDTGVGLHAGGLIGAQLFFTRAIGVDIGAGYVHHFVWHSVSGPFGTGRNVQLDLGQLVIRAGIAFAF